MRLPWLLCSALIGISVGLACDKPVAAQEQAGALWRDSSGDFVVTVMDRLGRSCASGTAQASYQVAGGSGGLLYPDDCDDNSGQYRFEDTEGAERCVGTSTWETVSPTVRDTTWVIEAPVSGFSCSTVGQIYNVRLLHSEASDPSQALDSSEAAQLEETEELRRRDTAYRAGLSLPSIRGIQVSREYSDGEEFNVLEGYAERQNGLIDDIVFFDDSYYCRGEERITFGCSQDIQSLMDELVLRRRALGQEDEIRISSNYENNCFDEDNSSSWDRRFTSYRFTLDIDDNEPSTGVSIPYSYQRPSAENYYVSCTISHDQARDVILSGALFSVPNEAIASLELEEARKRANILNEYYSGWRNQLLSCPCTRDRAEADVRFVDATYPVLTSTFHPGAVWEYRTDEGFVEDVLPIERREGFVALRPGQQCTYSRNGRLITDGEGAGTPDAYSPEVTHVGQGLVSRNSHSYWDVETFKASGMTWQEYQKTWIPNNGNNCPSNTGVSLT
jgi:hypothetical protein